MSTDTLLPFGLRQYIIPSLPCDAVFLRFARTHRRPRIAKKWRRFGVVNKPCPGRCYKIGRDLITCQCAFTKIKEMAK
jgi:hypothetical protein